MLQLRRIILEGVEVEDACVSFTAAANIIAGESDTGKSYLLRCIDYIFGADEFNNPVPLAEPYSCLTVEFENTQGQFLCLKRDLSGGDIVVYRCRVEEITGGGEKIAYRRRGKSTIPDVTSVLFVFSGIPEAILRANNDGKTQRLSIRNFIPLVLVDEISVIDEQSPILGRDGYSTTARERMFAFMLSGKDDKGVIAAERREITNTRLNAQISVITDLLAPLQIRLGQVDPESLDDTIERVEGTITSVTTSIAEYEDERTQLIVERQSANDDLQRAETQLIAIDELLTRYHLLAERYSSDLERLDFIAEGAYYFDSLQDMKCPLCDQLMTPEHVHVAAIGSENVYASARAEAAKILAQRLDLEEAVASLEARREARGAEQATAQQTIARCSKRLDEVVHPVLRVDARRLQDLLDRRVSLEMTRSDREQRDGLIAKKEELERNAASSRAGKREWEALPSKALREFCDEVEVVLKEWQWKGRGRVEFDARKYDLIIDGQARQSHGKGVRAVLYSAFVIGLLRYCARNNRPHLGFLIIDSPLTSYKKRGAQVKGAEGPIDLGVETAFWGALKQVPKNIQVIIVENKEPPADVVAAVHYEWFAGDTAAPGDRIGFIPPATRS
ncbi:MAG: hypothetical protein LKH33_04535 [Acetobacter sp.]|jgi:outer membrane murein-binding lipoprotein Lpp|nr:hypothetical protein [Acetobacter sp.]MCH4062008.1 hypothetical protein [Acetobacter sp.]MCH4089143.1 hypothetical protein [Acetobacter sp.]MCI1293131.1 hypothetical protein [Acetobacter sp.]MCI1320244.1 hypothetical protein [Acetobacter sp.]